MPCPRCQDYRRKKGRDRGREQCSQEGLAGKIHLGKGLKQVRESEPCSSHPFRGTVFKLQGTASADLETGSNRGWVLLVREGKKQRSGHRGLVDPLRRLDFILGVMEDFIARQIGG